MAEENPQCNGNRAVGGEDQVAAQLRSDVVEQPSAFHWVQPWFRLAQGESAPLSARGCLLGTEELEGRVNKTARA